MMVGMPDILNASILIVDDQEANVTLLEQLLSAADYTRCRLEPLKAGGL